MGGGERDGLPTILRIAAITGARAPIVVLSGEGPSFPHKAFLDAGALKVLQKPTTLEMLKTLPAIVRAAQHGGPRKSIVEVVVEKHRSEGPTAPEAAPSPAAMLRSLPSASSL